ncbi:glycosyl hydrolase family 28-related protein [Niveispirillum sp. KHB5.9]|uniref:glycosyl hydrolase family 28-related protein n=1 Tax=Niveispirillum sp. KHB5.9 TaxID=3400269 RepID=UPI003A8C36C2
MITNDTISPLRGLAWRWRRNSHALPLAFLLLLAPAGGANAETYPADSSALNVRNFGARGDGRTDDTAAFLAALAASGADTGTLFWQDKMVFVPDGTYRISAPLVKRYANGNFGSGFVLIGQSETGTVLKLADNAPGYGDPQRPQAVIFTTSKLLRGGAADGGKDYLGRGEGNDAYMNFVENMTIDVGRGNPGAVAIDYLGNNTGAIRHVTLKAGAGSGAVGLSMTRKWPGPTMVRNLTIDGFATGIATAQTEYGLTFEHIKLRNQTQAAISNSQNALTIRNLVVEGTAPAIINSGDKGFLAIEGGTAPVPGLTALIRNDGFVSVRGLSLAGNIHNGILQGRSGWQLATAPIWRTPFEDAPATPEAPANQWVSVARFGATGDPAQDATPALRAAFASGASVVYLPKGTYSLSDVVDVPAGLVRIVGMNSTIRILNRKPTFLRSTGMFRAATAGQPLFVERLAFDNTNLGEQVAIELSGTRDIVMRDIVTAGTTMLDRKVGGGKAFLENMCCGLLRITGAQPVFARQFNSEGTTTRIINRGSPLSILGLKTEGVCTVLDNREGARSDIFGGLVYVVRDGAPATVPTFINSSSWLSASFIEESLRTGSRYQVYVGRDATVGLASTLRAAIPVSGFPQRGYGRFIPNLVDVP